MGRSRSVVRLSSKGQVVIPAHIRRQLGLRTGQALAVRAGRNADIILGPVAERARDVEALLRRARSWGAARNRDLVSELHERRRRERARLRERR